MILKLLNKVLNWFDLRICSVSALKHFNETNIQNEFKVNKLNALIKLLESDTEKYLDKIYDLEHLLGRAIKTREETKASVSKVPHTRKKVKRVKR